MSSIYYLDILLQDKIQMINYRKTSEYDKYQNIILNIKNSAHEFMFILLWE